MAEYRMAAESGFIRASDGACIPPDPNNRDYAGVLKWLAAGNAPDPYDVAIQQAAAAETARVAGFKADSSQADLIQRLRTAPSDQIDTWLANNVTNLAQARTVLGAIVKYFVARRMF